MWNECSTDSTGPPAHPSSPRGGGASHVLVPGTGTWLQRALCNECAPIRGPVSTGPTCRATFVAIGRNPRIQLAGVVYHVGTRGNRRQPIYVAERDPLAFLEVLGNVAQRYRWRVHAYCLMPNHFHLEVETLEENISAGMRDLNGRYARWFNAQHDLTGHVFERRFFDELVETEPHVLALASYIPRNPLRAGLCAHPAEWPWSSYRSTVGLAPTPAFLETGWLLSQFADDDELARKRFARFVLEAVDRPKAA